MSRTPLLCIAGGGTGGHVMPALALADAARARWSDLRVDFIGAERGLEARLLPERGESALLLAMHGVNGAGLLQKLRVLLWELPKSVLHIRNHWRQHKPDLLVGVGGYASVSAVVAALLSGVPVVLYEQNAMPGLVNRTLGRFCRKMMLGFAAAEQHISSKVHCVVTGNIVRESIHACQWQMHQPHHLLVLGGSQGARVLNQTVPAACALLSKEGRVMRVTHIAGKEADALMAAQQAYAQAGIQAEVLPFCEDMAAFYQSGDLLIARAGAMTVSEAAISGMPALFLPLPHAADDHQRHNALALAGCGAARVLDQQQLTAESLAAEIEACLYDRDTLQAMSSASRSVAAADAADRQLAVLQPWLTVTDRQEVAA